MKLAIVVPCYNEEEVLPETSKRLLEVIENLVKKELVDEGQILFVDDGSRDKTWQLIEEAGEKDKRIGGLKLSCNRGHQYALWAGLKWSAEHSDVSISIDADLQDDVNAIYEMAEKFRSGYDIVFGVRKERKTDTFFKRTTALAFYRLMTTLGGKIIYNHADFRLMSRRAMCALMQYPEDNLFLRGMVPTVGFPSTSVYYNRSERFAGESKYPLKKMIAFSVKPLRLITYLGIVFILVAFGVIAYALYEHFAGHTIEGWTSLLVSLWFIGGSVFLACGGTGEYIGKIYLEVKHRPKYFIEKKTNA